MRLDPGESKNREGRMFPPNTTAPGNTGEAASENRSIAGSDGKIIPWLFHRDGKPINSFRKTCITACVDAKFGHVTKNTKGKVIKKVADKILHEFRRTAVRNLERASVARPPAMRMVGHKMESIYRRYAIADDSMLQDAGEKLARLHSADDNFTVGNKSKRHEAIPTKYSENSHRIE